MGTASSPEVKLKAICILGSDQRANGLNKSISWIQIDEAAFFHLRAILRLGGQC